MSVLITILLVLAASLASSALKRAGVSPEQKETGEQLRAGLRSPYAAGASIHL